MVRINAACLLLLTASVTALMLPSLADAQNVQLTNQTRQVLAYYRNQSAIQTLNQMPQRTAIQPATVGQLQHNGKPFEGTSGGQTISPYLNLFRDDRNSSEAVPAYYTFVRPQLEQQATFQQQQREIQQLQRKSQFGPQRPPQPRPAPARRPVSWIRPNSTPAGSASCRPLFFVAEGYYRSIRPLAVAATPLRSPRGANCGKHSSATGDRPPLAAGSSSIE